VDYTTIGRHRLPAIVCDTTNHKKHSSTRWKSNRKL